MNTFRISALAIAIVLALNSFAAAQCGARQVDTTNLNLGLQAQAAPVVVQGGGCANGQCGTAAAASTQSLDALNAQIARFNGLDSQFSAQEHARLAALVAQRQALLAGTSVAVNTPRVAVNVGVARPYQPLYVLTTPTAVVETVPTQYALVSAVQPAASASASAGASAAAASSVNGFAPQVLAVDPSVQVATVSACNGNCGRARILGRVLRPRRTVSVSRARSVTFN